MNDFFNLPEESTSSNSGYEKKIDENLYDPNPDNHGGVYKSIFRFIPDLREGNKSQYTKYTAKIWNPILKKSTIVDCPSNENKPSVLWTLSTILGKLYKEEPTVVKDINENFSRWYTHHSYVYVIKDPQLDSAPGSIKIFKYRAQVNDLIDNQKNPDEDGLLEKVESINPFHLLKGKDFLCVVTKKTKQWRDWTKCKFMDEVTPFRFSIKDTEVTMKDDPGAIKLLQEFFDKNAPSLDEYKHKSWTDETYIEVAEALKAAIPYKQVLDMLINETRDEKMKALLSGKNPFTSTDTAPLEPKQSNMSDNQTTFNNEDSKEEPTVESADSSLEKDEYDDIFKNL